MKPIFDDLLFDNSYVQIHVNSLAIGLRKGSNDPIAVKIKIDVTSSPIATQFVNLTVKYVKNN